VATVLLTGGICMEQGAKAPSAKVDSDVAAGSALTLNWAGLGGDLFNTIIYFRLYRPADQTSLGPYEAFVREDGSARKGIDDAYNPADTWTVYYWIDINNNQSCDEDGADFVRQYSLPLGAASATLNHTKDAAPGNLCDGPIYGIRN
jgi:hypothetical protein